MAEKRYFWLKLHVDFFSRKQMKALRRLPEGSSLVLIYEKMLLASLSGDGWIDYSGVYKDFIEELALTLDEDKNVVELTVQAVEQMGLIEIGENKAIYMRELPNFVGSESASAGRMRRKRSLDLALSSQGYGVASFCDNAGTTCDIEIESELELELENRKNSGDADGVARARMRDTELESLFPKYFGRFPTEGELQNCFALSGLFRHELLEHAFAKACSSDNKYMGYVTGVLKNFKERGIRDIEDVALDDLRHDATNFQKRR